jgi:hypothetical protein
VNTTVLGTGWLLTTVMFVSVTFRVADVARKQSDLRALSDWAGRFA